MTNRLTDEELEKLEQMDWEASDDWTGVYDAFDGVSTLKTGRITLTSDATDARDDVFMACAARNALPSLLAEVRELRAIVSQINDGDLRVLRAMARGVPAVAAPAEHVQISGKVKA